MNLQLNFKAIGAKLAKYRKETGMAQMEVARKLGYESPQFVSNIERGQCAAPPKLLRGLIKIYNLDTKKQKELAKLLKSEFSFCLKQNVGI